MNPVSHFLVYGEPGSGKSTFAATFPTPILVCCFDAYGKDSPYLRRGPVVDRVEVALGNDSVAAARVCDRRGELLIEVEYFHDLDVQNPMAFQRFLNRMATLTRDELAAWATVVIDSVTAMELCKRKQAQYKLLPHVKEPRLWFAASTDALEEMLMIRFAGLPTNVVVLAHVDEDKDEFHGEMIRNPSAPGRLRKRLASQYAELYRTHVAKDERGNRVHVLQTRTDGRFHASTQLGAPDPCAPEYEKLWERE